MSDEIVALQILDGPLVGEGHKLVEPTANPLKLPRLLDGPLLEGVLHPLAADALDVGVVGSGTLAPGVLPQPPLEEGAWAGSLGVRGPLAPCPTTLRSAGLMYM